MIPFFYFHDFWFVGDENNRNENNLFQKLVCSPSKVPISTRIILKNTINRSRMFNQLLLAQNIQISIIFLLVKSIIENWEKTNSHTNSTQTSLILTVAKCQKYQFYQYTLDIHTSTPDLHISNLDLHNSIFDLHTARPGYPILLKA